METFIRFRATYGIASSKLNTIYAWRRDKKQIDNNLPDENLINKKQISKIFRAYENQKLQRGNCKTASELQWMTVQNKF